MLCKTLLVASYNSELVSCKSETMHASVSRGDVRSNLRRGTWYMVHVLAHGRWSGEQYVVSAIMNVVIYLW